MKCALIRLDTGQPFVDSAEIVTNDDGSVSFRLAGGSWAGQEPDHYAVRHDDPSAVPGVYQRATLTGSCCTFVTRPQDKPMVYLCGQGKAY